MSLKEEKEGDAAGCDQFVEIQQYLQKRADLWGSMRQEAKKQGLPPPPCLVFRGRCSGEWVQWENLAKGVIVDLDLGLSSDWRIESTTPTTTEKFSFETNQIPECVAKIKEKLAQELWSDG